MEEEDYDGCDGADPRHCLDGTLLSLADGILLRSIIATTAGAAATAVGSTKTRCPQSMSWRFIGWEDLEGDNGNSVRMEDDDFSDAEAGEYACNFLEVAIHRL